MTETTTGLSNDAKAILQYQAQKKSAALAYLFWLFLGMFGAHRFYLGREGSGTGIFFLTLAGILTAVMLIGYVLLAAAAVWVLIDVFLIGGWVKMHNLQLLSKLGA